MNAYLSNKTALELSDVVFIVVVAAVFGFFRIFSQFLLFFQCCIQSTLTDEHTHTHKSHCNCKKWYLLATCTRTHTHTRTLSRRHKQLIEQIYFLLPVQLLLLSSVQLPLSLLLRSTAAGQLRAGLHTFFSFAPIKNFRSKRMQQAVPIGNFLNCSRRERKR